MANKYRKFSNQHCYYSNLTGQVFTQVSLSELEKKQAESLGILEKFDSLLEARVYAALKIFEAETNASKINFKAVITRQFPIEVKPETETFNPIIYKADFRLDLTDGTKRIAPMSAFIEAKGVETPEYRLKMKFLEYFEPSYFHAIVQVTDKRKPNSIVPSMSLKELPQFLIKMVETYFYLRMTPEGQLDNYKQMAEDVVALLSKIDAAEFN